MMDDYPLTMAQKWEKYGKLKGKVDYLHDSAVFTPFKLKLMLTTGAKPIQPGTVGTLETYHNGITGNKRYTVYFPTYCVTFGDKEILERYMDTR